MLPALLYLELDGNRVTKANEGAVEVPAHTGAPKFSTGASTPERLRRRREEPATRGAGGGPRQVAGDSHRLSRFSPFRVRFLCFETALCLNTIIPFITNLALLRESYIPTPIND